jgi:hypothetical protein
MSTTVLVALTALDATADQLLDTLAAMFPVSAFRGTSGVWLVEVDQEGQAAVGRAEEQVAQALTDINRGWRDVIKLGLTEEGVHTPSDG